ncbi:MAG TPA: thioredoxin family protein [Thiobacillaceae bacterium]
MTRRPGRKYVFLLLACLLAGNAGAGSSGDLGYRPAADPFHTLKAAQSAARAKHKKILVIAGGAWCRWCHVLDRFLSGNEDVRAELHKEFEIVKVYVGEENDNAAFFSTLPRAAGYPHLWVLSGDGRVLASVDTGRLEKGRDGNDKAAFLAAIRKGSGQSARLKPSR